MNGMIPKRKPSQRTLKPPWKKWICSLCFAPVLDARKNKGTGGGKQGTGLGEPTLVADQCILELVRRQGSHNIVMEDVEGGRVPDNQNDPTDHLKSHLLRKEPDS